MNASGDTVLRTAKAWLQAGHGAALATVVSTWGSAPRPPGSLLAIRADGVFSGSVSGGCVEGAVIADAESVIESGRPRLLSFGVSNETAWSAGLACGGQIEVFIESFQGLDSDGTLRAMIAAEENALPLVRAVRLSDGQCALVRIADPASTPLAQAAHLAARDDKSQTLTLEGERWFLHVLNPGLHLIVVGAVHIALPLIQMAKVLGMRVTLIDPRTAFASQERFPNDAILTDWPDEALARLALNARTAIVTLTHDPKLDDPALVAALRSDALYVGALGSRKTHAARLERLKSKGLNDTELTRIHAPVGLDIGALSPAEIALSVLAEIVKIMRGTKRP